MPERMGTLEVALSLDISWRPDIVQEEFGGLSVVTVAGRHAVYADGWRQMAARPEDGWADSLLVALAPAVVAWMEAPDAR